MSSSPPAPSRRRRYRGLLLFFGIAGWATGALLLLWLTLPLGLPLALAGWNAKAKQWDQLHFELTHVDATQLVIDNVHFQNGPIDIRSEGLTVTYAPTSLWRGRVQSILLRPVEIHLAFPLENAADSQTHAEFPELMNLPLPSLPFEELLASDIALTLKPSNPGPAFQLESQWHIQATPDWLDVQASLASGRDRVHVAAQLSSSDPAQRVARIDWNVEDPLALLQQIQPWLPNPVSDPIRESNWHTGALFGSMDWAGSSQTLTSRTVIESLQLPSLLQLQTVELVAALEGKNGSLDGFLSVASIDIEGIGNTSLFAQFNVDAALGESPHLTLDASIAGFPGTAASEATASLQLDPFETRIKFDRSAVDLQLPLLRSADLPLALEDIQLHVKLPDPNQPARFSGSANLQPAMQGWRFDSPETESGNALSLQWEGTHDAGLPGWDGLQSQSTLTLSAHRLTGVFPMSESDEVQVNVLANGTVQLEQAGPHLKLASTLALSSADLRLDQDHSLLASGFIELGGTLALIEDWSLFNPWRDLRESSLRLQLNAKGRVAGFPVQAEQLQVTTGDATPEEFPFALKAQALQLHTVTLLQPQVEGHLSACTLSASFGSTLIHPSLQIQGSLTSSLPDQSHAFQVRMHSSTPGERIQLNLETLLPDLAPTLFSGLVDLAFQGAVRGESINIGLRGSVLDGTLTIPNSGIVISGIQLPTLQVDDFVSTDGGSEIPLQVDRIQLPPTEIFRLSTTIRLLPEQAIEVDGLQFEFCGGIVRLQMEEALQAPFDSARFRLQFEGVDLAQLTALIPDFKEDLNGRIDGYLPVQIEKGHITWDRGEARLTPGTNGRLRYAEDGLIAAYIPEIKISKQIDADVKEALRDLTLTDLSIQIQSSVHFDQPSVVILSGHSNHPRIEVPIERIQLNIRAGDAPGLLNRSFNTRHWLESLLIQNDGSGN